MRLWLDIEGRDEQACFSMGVKSRSFLILWGADVLRLGFFFVRKVGKILGIRTKRRNYRFR